MARICIHCVVQDGSGPTDGTLPRQPIEQPVAWPIGDAGTIVLDVVTQDGAPFDLTGYTLSVVARRHLDDVAPVFAVDAVNDVSPSVGTAVATLASDATAAMVGGIVYWYDVHATKTGSRQQVAPASKWLPFSVVGRSGEPA